MNYIAVIWYRNDAGRRTVATRAGTFAELLQWLVAISETYEIIQVIINPEPKENSRAAS